MLYYECYYIRKSNNFNVKLNHIFHNMEHQTLVTFIVIRVTMIAFTFVQFVDILNKFVIENSMKSKLNI
jgi:hypothetical protein